MIIVMRIIIINKDRNNQYQQERRTDVGEEGPWPNPLQIHAENWNTRHYNFCIVTLGVHSCNLLHLQAPKHTPTVHVVHLPVKQE